MRATLLVGLFACAVEDAVEPEVPLVVVPPMVSEPVDSGWLEPQGELPPDAFGCPDGTFAIGQSRFVEGIVVPTRQMGVGVCLRTDRRIVGSPDCVRETFLPAATFEATAVELDGAGEEVHVCYRRVFDCPEGRQWLPALKGGRGSCLGDGLEYVLVWLEAGEPASIVVR